MAEKESLCEISSFPVPSRAAGGEHCWEENCIYNIAGLPCLLPGKHNTLRGGGGGRGGGGIRTSRVIYLKWKYKIYTLNNII